MKFRCVFVFMCLLGALPAWSQISTVPGLEIKGPYASVKKNKDGTEEKFDKTPDERTITKRTFSAEGVLRLTTVYRMSEGGNPVNCDILDGRGIKLFKSRYGYSRNKDNPLSYGKLVEEQMFDARVKRIDPNTGEEMPVRRFVYTYNADGSQNKPYSIVLVPGKTYEEAYGAGPSGLNYDPFDPKNADKSGKSKTRK